MRLPIKKVLPFVIFSVLVSVLVACGGGGGGGEIEDTTNDADATPAISGFDFELHEGDFWEYVWVYSHTTTSPDGTSGESDAGYFRITLGAPALLDGKTAYPLNITGKTTDPTGTTYAANPTHIAVDGNQILISADGVTLTVIFDANTAQAAGEFFGYLPISGTAAVTSVEMNNQFVNGTTAYRVGASTDDPLCEAILGDTICSDEASSITAYEYYKPGIGPISYYIRTSNTYTDGGYTTSHTTERTLGVVESSLSAPDGYTPAGPWRVRAESPVTDLDDWFTAGAVLNDKIYIVRYDKLHIYDVATHTWTAGPDAPASILNGEALAYGDLIHVFAYNDIYTFDPVSTIWSTHADAVAVVGDWQQHATGIVQCGGVDRYGVFLDQGNTDVFFYDFLESSEHVLWSPSYYPGATSYRSLAVRDSELYVFGGATSGTDSMESYKIIPCDTAPGWARIADMPRALSRADSVVHGGKIYVVGDFTVDEYEPLSDTWTPKTSPFLSMSNAMAFEVAGKIYFVTASLVLEYDPSIEP